jgi:hypothetical protein
LGCDCQTLFGIFADVDSLSGGAGWVGAGLLGLVLGWLLLKHLPEKDAQIERLIARADERGDKQDAEHQRSLAMIMDRHDARNKEMIMAMREEFARMIVAIQERSQSP